MFFRAGRFCQITFVFFFTFGICFKSFSQNFEKEKSLTVNATCFSVDKLGNIYTVSEGNVNKYDAEGALLYTFSNKGNGNIDFIDATNPLRILVFVKDFSIIYFFDNHLVLQSTLDLRQQLLIDAWPICNSAGEGFWIYDRKNFLLLKLDGNLKEVAKSQPLNLTITDELKPIRMCEGENYLTVLNDGIGLMIFDRLGSYYKTYKDTAVKNFTLKDDVLMYFSDEKLHVVNIKSGVDSVYELNLSSLSDIAYFNNKVYVLKGNQIEIYSQKK
jgi:hypothetical protein